ncbi:MAG: T9SS type A sorting domain-containing protein, partial [Bacteroidota bacterium]
GNDDGPCGLQSEIEIAATTSLAPITYLIYVTGHATATGDFTLTITSSVPLPVELISFEGVAEEKSNRLMWKTASEENTEWHIIERSLDGRTDWQEIGKQQAVGFTIETQSYQLEDVRPTAKAYYRLRSVDFDGYEDVSEVVYIERRSKAFGIVSVFPNPTKASLNVDFEVVEEQTIELHLTDMLGRSVAYEKVAANAGLNNFQFDMSRLANGIYFINIVNDDQRLSKRVVKQ